jgi:hypothetical protein
MSAVGGASASIGFALVHVRSHLRDIARRAQLELEAGNITPAQAVIVSRALLNLEQACLHFLAVTEPENSPIDTRNIIPMRKR